jgi:general secretion pathway protein A
MYEKFFGFTEAPFNQTPDPQFFFSSPTHEDAFSQVLYGITQRKGFIVILGEVGTGKTTLCRHLLETLDPGVKTALILNPGMTTLDLLMSVNEEFGIKCRRSSKKKLVDELHRFLLDTLGVGGNALLMIDEAQNLSVKCLEEIRLLSNLETTTQKLLQIVLLGQPELGDLLRRKELRQLAQRVALRAHLVPLDPAETAQYIASRIRAAGGEGKVHFTASAVDRVHALSGGIPRLINTLCDKALLAGFITDATVIDESLVEEAGREVGGRARVTRGSLSKEFARSAPAAIYEAGQREQRLSSAVPWPDEVHWWESRWGMVKQLVKEKWDRLR